MADKANILFALFALCAACAADSAEDGTECPTVATSCPAGCYEIVGQEFVGTCAKAPSAIACSKNAGGTLDMGCIKSTIDGQLYETPHGYSTEVQLEPDPAWDLCTLEEKDKVRNTPLCM